jgi:hypothetical protein
LDEAKSEAEDVAKEFLITKAPSLVAKYKNLGDSLEPKQAEYVKRMTYIRSVDAADLDLDESIELGDYINEAANLGLEISKELNEFWNEFGEVVSEAAEKFVDIGAKVLSKTLIGLIFV